jgi:hypothetical protein
MNTSVSVQRAGLSALLYLGVMGGLSVATGNGFNLKSLGIDGLIVAASGVGSDFAHGIIGMAPTRSTSAVAAGAIFAGIQSFRGDKKLMFNFIGGAGNDYMVDVLSAAGY